VISTSGGPLPATRYPAVPGVARVIRTGAGTAEAAQLGGPAGAGCVCGGEPDAATVADAHAAARTRAVPRRGFLAARR